MSQESSPTLAREAVAPLSHAQVWLDPYWDELNGEQEKKAVSRGSNKQETSNILDDSTPCTHCDVPMQLRWNPGSGPAT